MLDMKEKRDILWHQEGNALGQCDYASAQNSDMDLISNLNDVVKYVTLKKVPSISSNKKCRFLL